MSDLSGSLSLTGCLAVETLFVKHLWLHVLAVGVGCGLGSSLRVFLVSWLRSWELGWMPWATFSVNLLGAFGAGGVFGWRGWWAPAEDWAMSLLLFGFFGGLTTVSAYAAQGVSFLRAGSAGRGLCYLISTPVFCVAAVWMGWTLFAGIRGFG